MMDAYDNIVYLDTPKTASSFISNFLKDNLHYNKRHFVKHGRIGTKNAHYIKRRYSELDWYFISVRHPLHSYYSLYNYGLDGKGGLFNRLKKQGLERLYTQGSFIDWLWFMLDSKNAKSIGEGYQLIDSCVIGFQTFRFLSLSMSDSIETMSKKPGDLVLDGYKHYHIHSFVVRQEALVDDMEILIKYKLYKSLNADVSTVVNNLKEYSLNKINASSERNKSKIPDLPDLPKDLSKLLLYKERFLIRQFYSPVNKQED